MAQQKFRLEHGAYLVEGDKLCREWLREGRGLRLLAALPSWIDEHRELISRHPDLEVAEADEHQLQQAGSLQQANRAILVASFGPEPAPADVPSLLLDTLQDPGNLGTILRTADWFGLKQVVLSPGCADPFNPKVIQSAMGSHLRIDMVSADLGGFMAGSSRPVYAAVLGGTNIFGMGDPEPGHLLLGNESRGIGEALLAGNPIRVTIPGKGGAESLNVAVATGILCAWLYKGRAGA